MEATALAYFIWFFAVLQWTIAVWLLAVPQPGPARVSHAALFLLNGIATLTLGTLFTEPLLSSGAVIDNGAHWLFAAFHGTDGPTSAWLLFLAYLFRRGPGLDIPWDRLSRIGTIVLGGYTLGHILLASLRPDLYKSLQIYTYTGGHLLTLAYIALFIVLGRNLVGARTHDDRRVYSFLFIAFGSRAIEFAFVYGWTEPTRRLTLWHPAIAHVLYLLLGLVALAVLAHIAWHAFRHPPRREALTATLAGAFAVLLFAIGYYATDLGTRFWAFNLLTLILVRPLFVALAYDIGWTIRTSGFLGILAGVFLLTKGFAAQVLDQAFWTLGRTDLIALGMVALAAVPFLLHRTPRLPPEAPTLTHAQRLALYLHEAQQRDPDGRGVTSADIQEALGISPNNVAGELRRAERLLAEGTDQDAALIETRVLGVRGRKYFRLSDHGRRAAAATAETLGGR